MGAGVGRNMIADEQRLLPLLHRSPGPYSTCRFYMQIYLQEFKGRHQNPVSVSRVIPKRLSALESPDDCQF